jgi:hypothetical protein
MNEDNNELEEPTVIHEYTARTIDMAPPVQTWAAWMKDTIGTNDLSPKTCVVAFFAIVVLQLSYILFNPTPPACDMSIAQNRDFNHFYGISVLKNHFTTPTADACDSAIIFRPALPQSILKPDNSASSFLTLAKYGTGKTLVRCEYYKLLPSDKYLKILILNKEINEYLDRYISRATLHHEDCEKNNCLSKWSHNEFAQLLLSSLVGEFIRTHPIRREYPSSSSLDEKIDYLLLL